MLKLFFFLKIDYRLLKIDLFLDYHFWRPVNITLTDFVWWLVAGTYWAAVRYDAAVKAGGGEAGLQTDWTCRLNRWPSHATSNSSFSFPRDKTMPLSFHTCYLLHAAVSLPPPHSLWLTECSCDRSVSLVGWGGRLAGVAICLCIGVCWSERVYCITRCQARDSLCRCHRQHFGRHDGDNIPH